MRINKIMFITCQPFLQKPHFKFSNKLAGKTYNNTRFLSSCSYIESDFKLSTAGSEEDNARVNKRRRLNNQTQLIKTHDAHNNPREVYSAFDKIGSKINHSVYNSLRRSAAVNLKQSRMQKTSLAHQVHSRRTSLVETAFAMTKPPAQTTVKINRKKHLKRKLAFNQNIDKFYTPYVYIRIIDKIKDLKEIDNKSIKVNFQKIYKKLIKTQLMGEFTAIFMQTVQRYIRDIVQSNQMNENPFEIELEPELKTISRKEQFLDRLMQLWDMGDNLKIHELIKFYCIPSQQTSQKILKQLIKDLVIQVYEKKSCNRDIQYTLLTSQGNQVIHISQVYFSTLQLLFTPKQTFEKDYVSYRALLDQHDRSLKMTIKQSIKHNFVEKIVNNQIDQQKINYQQDPSEYNQYRKELVQKATIKLESKQTLRLQSKKIKQKKQSTFKFELESEENHQDTLFTKYMLRKKKQKAEYKSILQKLRQILDPSHIYYVKRRVDESTQEQFRKIHPFNDKYDITYNYNKQHNRTMLLVNFIENCDILSTKTNQQLSKILTTIETVYGVGIDNMKQISYWQFKEIYQTARGVAHRETIMKFVLNYFTFDQYQQMSKQAFFATLDICLSQFGRPKKIIKQIAWSIFEKMGLIVNKALNKRNLSIWYEPIKIVYLMLLSIIFGSEYGSIEQMVNDLINYYD